MYYVSKCIYPKKNKAFMNGWIIEHDKKYPFWINKFLHQMNNSSEQTSKQYAYKLCKFLNYLEEYHNIDYSKATASHLNKFFTYMTYGTDHKIVSISEAKMSGFTLKGYFTVIKRFYEYLYNNNKTINIELKLEKVSLNKNSYLYGQYWETQKAKLVINNSLERGKDPIEYEKWYTEEQQDAILSQLNTYRDKTIFSISCDGLRIDEILSSLMNGYDDTKGFLDLYKSKGKQTGNVNRTCVLSERSRKFLEEYLFNERSFVEEELLNNGKIPPNQIFLNLRKRDDLFGLPVSYHNILEIIKKAAKKAGFDPKKIRTHSGRSTKAGQLFRMQAKNPQLLTDNQILEIMGWKNMSSAEPYKNRLDKETAIENWNTLNKAKENRCKNEK